VVSLICSLLGAALVPTPGPSAQVYSPLLRLSPLAINLLFYLCLIHLTKTALPGELVGAEMKPFALAFNKRRPL
jgi:hypothetical protein